MFNINKKYKTNLLISIKFLGFKICNELNQIKHS